MRDRCRTVAFGCVCRYPCDNDVIRVMLAEDQAMVRGALKALLSLEEDLTVVADVGRGDQIVEAAIATRPDVALLDIEMPGIDGLVAARALRDALPSCRSLILTTFARPGLVRRAIDSGAYGYLLKDAPHYELARAIRRCAAGESVIEPSLAFEALAEGASPLSSKESAVLAESGRGGSIADVASALSLSEGTVRNHLSAAIQKLRARNRADAARIAREKGWL
jgi:two-component system, NarL family, response regulator DesR